MSKSQKTKNRRERSEMRGFPSAEALRDLATMYLELCGELYPDFVARGVLPAISDESISNFVRNFTDTWKAQQYTPPAKKLTKLPGYKLSIAYVRFSDSSSNPRSLAQQLNNIMRWAANNGYVIPPEAIFADAAVSATTSRRKRYKIARKAIEDCQD
jgi:hypothetical protein